MAPLLTYITGVLTGAVPQQRGWWGGHWKWRHYPQGGQQSSAGGCEVPWTFQDDQNYHCAGHAFSQQWCVHLEGELQWSKVTGDVLYAWDECSTRHWCHVSHKPADNQPVHPGWYLQVYLWQARHGAVAPDPHHQCHVWLINKPPHGMWPSLRRVSSPLCTLAMALTDIVAGIPWIWFCRLETRALWLGMSQLSSPTPSPQGWWPTWSSTRWWLPWCHHRGPGVTFLSFPPRRATPST